MKNIKTTSEHDLKLLEMCLKLNFKVEIMTGLDDKGNKIPQHVLTVPFEIEYGEEWDLEYLEINNEIFHWFEFCLTHLYNEIKRYGVSETLTYTNLMSAGNHPIDYLYKEFKKLKL